MISQTFISTPVYLSFKEWLMAFICLIIFDCTVAQNLDNEILQTKSYTELNKLFNSLSVDALDKKETIAKFYLKKSKIENDTVNIARGYYLFSIMNDQPRISKLYADSIIYITKNINHSSFPASGYFLKGYWCYELSEYQEALQNYLIGDSIAKSKGNISQSVINRKMIALLKNRAGDYRGALKIYLKEIDSLDIIKNESFDNYSDYLNRLYNTSLTYMHLKVLDTARIYSFKGLKESLTTKDSLLYFDFVYNLGVIDYLSGKEISALENINKALIYIDDYSKAMAYYYKGEMEIHNQNENAALTFFSISDSIASKLNYTFPELRSIYEYRIGFYENNSDLQNQLIYINKLLHLDSTLTQSKDLQLEIVKKYDRPILLYKKESIISKLQNKNKLGERVILVFGISTIILISLVINYRRKQSIYLTKFHELLSVNEPGTKSAGQLQSIEVIPVDIYKNITIGLKKFETQNEFLKPITLLQLAKNLDTNASYLSKFINNNSGHNYSQYVNRLRIEYVIERLKTDTKLRSYTVKAIAEEIGFGTPQSFSKAFYNETGIYPSYFIRKLENN